MNTEEILDKIKELDKYYRQSIKPVDQRLLVPGKEAQKEKAENAKQKAYDAFTVMVDALLNASTADEQGYWKTIIHNIQTRAKNAAILEGDFHQHAEQYGEYYDNARYHFWLPICQLAYQEEQNGIAEEHALKLAVCFDIDTGLKYLRNPTARPGGIIHDACLFTIPNVQQCAFAVWKKKLKQYCISDPEEFLTLFPNAEELGKFFNTQESDSKKDVPALEKLKEDARMNIKRYKQLRQQRIKSGLTPAQEKEYKACEAKIAEDRIAIFEAAKGTALKNADLIILSAYNEKYIQKNSKAYQYMLNHGLTKKDYGKFINLKRTPNNDEQIPNICIDGAAHGYPGIYLKKVQLSDEQEAARAACFGKLTHCCQSLSGEAGEPCVIHGLTSPYGGFYVVCQGDVNNPTIDDPVLGQAWTWRAQSGAIGFDSIESSRENDTAVNALFSQLTITLVNTEKTQKVFCGATSGISSKEGIIPLISQAEYPKDYSGYRDSHNQRLLYDSTTKPYYFIETHPDAQHHTEKLIDAALMSEQPLQDNPDFCELLNFSMISDENYFLIDMVKTKAQAMNKLEAIEALEKIWKDFLDGEIPIDEILKNPEKRFLFLAVNRKRETLLHQAIQSSNLKMTQKILKDPRCQHIFDISSDTGDTPLHLAVTAPGTDFIKALVEAGVNPNIRGRYGDTPLMRAIKNKDTEKALWLLNNVKGINVDFNDHDENHPVMMATKFGMLDVAEKLIEINEREETALLLAAYNGLGEVCTRLIAHGADINAKNNYGDTPLLLAAFNGHGEVCTQLIEHGADVNVKNNDGDTALLLAAYNGLGEVCIQLIEHGADVNVKNNDGDTALLLAAYNGLGEVCIQLIEHGADINAKDNDGDTPLLLAAINGHGEVCTQLIAARADVNVKDTDGTTPLMFAIKNKLDKVCIQLIENGAEVTKQNRKRLEKLLGKSALNEAMQKSAAYQARKHAVVFSPRDNKTTPPTPPGSPKSRPH